MEDGASSEVERITKDTSIMCSEICYLSQYMLVPKYNKCHIFGLNMINIIHLSTFIFLIKTVSSFSVPEDEFNVYGHVPGLEQSQFYRLRLRKYGSEDWHEPFTFVTECSAAKFCNTTGMYNHLRDWSNSYINFEMLDGVNINNNNNNKLYFQK